jgi:hypothetical protein
MAIPSGISERFTISGTKLKVKLDGSLNSAMISEARTINKILDVVFLGQINAIRSRRDFNPKKIMKRFKIRHEKLFIEACFDKSATTR